MKEWFVIDNEEDLLSPSLLFYEEHIIYNIHQMITIAGDVQRLRPHIKTYKCGEIISLQMDYGISKFKCATLAEAALLGSLHVPDVLIAYPLVGPNIRAMSTLMDKYPKTRFSALIDHPSLITSWNTVFTDRKVDLFIDVNVGMNRTGTSKENVLALFSDLYGTTNLCFRGLHIYDGHIRDEDPIARQQSVEAACSGIDDIIAQISKVYTAPFENVYGGSVSFMNHARYPERQLSPGTTLIWDHGYQSRFSDIPMKIAAVVATRVISKPSTDTICLDLGHKAIASEMKVAPAFFPQIPDAKISVHSEEHMAVETDHVDQWPIGKLSYAIPWHVCPTVALHEEAIIVRNHKVIDNWTITARKRLPLRVIQN